MRIRTWDPYRPAEARRRFGLAAALILLLVAAAWTPGNHLLQPTELAVYDWHLRALPSLPVDPRIAIVGIDEETSGAIPGMDQDAYPVRACHAQVTDELRRAGAAVIVYDVMFRDAASGDRSFATALRRHGNVVGALSPDIRSSHGHTSLIYRPITAALRPYLLAGSRLAPPSAGGIVRWLNPYQQDWYQDEIRYPHLAYAAVAAYSGARAASPVIDDGQFRWGSRISLPLAAVDGAEESLIRYSGPPGTYASIPYQDVYNGKWRQDRPADLFARKIVFIGQVRHRLDRIPTPLGDMPHVEIMAQAAQMALEGSVLHALPSTAQCLLAVVLSAMVLLLSYRYGTAAAPVAAILLGCAWPFTAHAVFLYLNVWLPTILPVVAMVSTAAMALAYEPIYAMVVRQMAWRSRSSVGTIPASTVVQTKPGERYATVAYCAIQNIAALRTALPAAWYDALMKQYEETARTISRRHGTEWRRYSSDSEAALLCFEGGGFFGAGKEPHPLRAVHWAMEMEAAAERIRRSGAAGADGFQIGVGIATGNVQEGTVQSSTDRGRPQPTILGDVAHVAYRLCEATGHMQRTILLDGITHALILDSLPCESLFQIHVKGRQELVDLYSPVRPTAEP